MNEKNSPSQSSKSVETEKPVLPVLPPLPGIYLASDLPNRAGPPVPMQQSFGADDSPQGKSLQRALNRALEADNLIVLAGSGTSLALNSPGNHVAPSMSDLWAACEERDRATFSNILGLVDYNGRASKGADGKAIADIELLLSLCEAGSMSEGEDGPLHKFVADAKQVILEKTDFCSHVEPARWADHDALLRKLARRSERQQRLKLFTTNYDLAFETAASRTGFIVIDGFDFSQPSFFNPMWFSYDVVARAPSSPGAPSFLPNVFHLYKLHGSVSWRRVSRGVVKSHSKGEGLPVLIHPSRSKYQASYDHPYLEMVSAFLSALRQPSTSLMCIGFGFNDNHLNNSISLAMRTNPDLSLIVATRGLFNSTGSFNPDFRQLATAAITAGDGRIALVDCGFDQFASYLPARFTEGPEEALRALGLYLSSQGAGL